MLLPASSLMPAALETCTWELPSWVLSRRRAVFAALDVRQLSKTFGSVLIVSLRLFLEGDCGTLRAIRRLGRRSDRKRCDLSAIHSQQVAKL